MAYYTALITAWGSSIQPPAGVTGTGLSSAQSTTTKLNNINSWTVTGAIPTNILTTGSALVNCINSAEFNTLTATQQSNILNLCAIPGQFKGGSTNTGLLPIGMFITYFSTPSSPTMASLTALAQSLTQTWAQANGYNYLTSTQGNINNGDLAAANSSIGGLT